MKSITRSVSEESKKGKSKRKTDLLCFSAHGKDKPPKIANYHIQQPR
jgi:hypothetical protein